MMKFFNKKSKKGVTLVESVFAVVILAIMAIGIIALLTASGTKIAQISKESAAYADAVQKLDLLISAISNGYGEVVEDEDEQDATRYTLEFPSDASYGDPAAVPAIAGILNEINLSNIDIIPAVHSADNSLRGWYVTLNYKGVNVTGFASDTEGVFDRQ